MGSGETVELRLPSAPPSQYLRWMSYWRRIERKMAANPFLEALASAASAPFLHDEVARFISRDLVPQIERQARRARRARRRSVAPTLEGDRELLSRSLDYVIRRAQWLQRPETSAITGLPPLEEEVANLRARTVAVLQLQLQEASDPGGDPGPPPGGDAGPAPGGHPGPPPGGDAGPAPGGDPDPTPGP